MDFFEDIKGDITIKEVIIELGLFLKKKRKEEKITQSQLAKQLGISRETVSNIEKGKSNFTIEILLKILKYYGILNLFADFFKKYEKDIVEINLYDG